MKTPASAALLLAALAALPSKGTEADNATFSNNADINNEISPTVNILYEMLYIQSVNNKSTSLFNSTNISVNISNVNFKNLNNFITTIAYNNNDDKSPIVDNDNNDNEKSETDVLSENGAKINISDVRILTKRQGRRKRVVSVVRTVVDFKNGTGVSDVKAVTVNYSSVSPMVLERRKKPGESGSSAPLLNYIFDTYSHSHQHRNDRAGAGNSIYAAAAPEVEALVGSTAHLDCKVDALHDKLVSWVRRKSDEAPMDLLTTGTQLYTADDRYSSKFIPPDIWRLEVKEVRPSDAAHYDCQLSAHPPRTARVTLQVPEVSVRIVDGAGAAVSEQVCEEGSTVALRCEVRGLRMEGGPALLWFRRDALLNDDTTRGGISVRTEFGMNGANSVLRVARVRANDAGRYTCSVAKAPPITLPPATVLLHVIKGESLAELHQGGSISLSTPGPLLVILITICAYFYT